MVGKCSGGRILGAERGYFQSFKRQKAHRPLPNTVKNKKKGQTNIQDMRMSPRKGGGKDLGKRYQGVT